MRKQLSLLLGGAAMAVAILVAGNTAALAATPAPTVKSGGIEVAFVQSGSSTYKDTTSGNTLTCTGGSALVNPAATITAFSQSGCTGPLGISAMLTADGLPWAMNATSVAGGVTKGTITGITVAVSGPLCMATLTGTVDISYTNSTSTAVISPDGNLLTVKSGASCLGIIVNGDVIDFNSTWVETSVIT
jgi:hypothetical protein